jgi:peptidoglycan/xylan/chitin deacetylase (PgdA/CDA1 family)
MYDVPGNPATDNLFPANHSRSHYRGVGDDDWYSSENGRTVIDDFEDARSDFAAWVDDEYMWKFYLGRLPARNYWRYYASDGTPVAYPENGDAKKEANGLFEKNYKLFGWDYEYNPKEMNYETAVNKFHKCIKNNICYGNRGIRTNGKIVILMHEDWFTRNISSGWPELERFLKMLKDKKYNFQTIDKY